MDNYNSRPVIAMAVIVMLATGMIVLALPASPGTLGGKAGPGSLADPVIPATTRTPVPAENPATMTTGAAAQPATSLPASARVTATAPRYNGSVNISEEQALARLRKDYPDFAFPLVSIALTDGYFKRVLYECIITETGDPKNQSDDENLTVYIDAGSGTIFQPGEENAKITIRQAEDAARKAFPDIKADEIRIKFTDFEKQGMRAWEFRMEKDDREFLSGLLDADTGELRNYNFLPRWSDAAGGSPVTREQARAIADAEMRKRNGDLPVRVIDNQSGRVAGFSGLPDPGSYSFRYERLISTVPCALDGIVINVNAKTGKVGLYSRRWAVPEGAVAASPVPAMSRDTAAAIVEKEARARYPGSAGSLRIITADLLWDDEYNEFKTTPAPGSIPLGWSVAFDDATIRAQEYPNRGRAWVDAQNGTLLEFQYIHPPLNIPDPGVRVIAEYGLDTFSPEMNETEQRSFLPGDFSRILQPDLEPYASPKGPVRGMGKQSDGPLTLRIDQNWTLNQTMIDEIYHRIAIRAKEYSVDPLPCRFVWEQDGTAG